MNLLCQLFTNSYNIENLQKRILDIDEQQILLRLISMSNCAASTTMIDTQEQDIMIRHHTQPWVDQYSGGEDSKRFNRNFKNSSKIP